MTRLSSRFQDRWTCDLSGDGEFKVKVIRNFIDDLFLPSSDVATRWVKFIPIKVNVFSWRARRDRLPTRVNLSRRGVLLDSHLCPLCNAVWDVQHVSFDVTWTRVVCGKICRWWDLDWQEICSFSDWDAWFLSFRLSSRLKSILEANDTMSKVATQMKDLPRLTLDERLMAMSVIGRSEPLSVMFDQLVCREKFVWHRWLQLVQ
ncbi:RNA-directed DNA polymerase, eukaryota [Tanacetum coccineum]